MPSPVYAGLRSLDLADATTVTVTIDLPPNASTFWGVSAHIQTVSQGPLWGSFQLAFRDALGFIDGPQGFIRADAAVASADRLHWVVPGVPMTYRPVINAIFRNESGATITNIQIGVIAQ